MELKSAFDEIEEKNNEIHASIKYAERIQRAVLPPDSYINEILPEHVLQIAHGDGEQGRALVESRVSMIAFTGSQAAGKDIMARASGQLKRLVMELGGNDPMIVVIYF